VLLGAQAVCASPFPGLRDFEGLSGHLHATRSTWRSDAADVPALGSEFLLACSSTSAHAAGDPESRDRDLQKLAMLASP